MLPVLQSLAITRRTKSDGASRGRAALLLAALFFFAVLAHAETHTVVIQNMRFQPAQLTVQPGDTIEWTNQDIFSHTATANNGSFDSPLLEPGQSWSTAVREAGTVAYYCRPHPNMTAALIIVAPGQVQAAGDGSHAAGDSLAWSIPRYPQQFHPILVNFTAALLPLGIFSDLLGRLFRSSPLRSTGAWMTLYAAVVTPFTAAAGWWWKLSLGGQEVTRVMMVHQWLGTFAAVAFIVLAVWRWRIYRRDEVASTAYLAFGMVLVLALVYQGSLGGKMAFGV